MSTRLWAVIALPVLALSSNSRALAATVYWDLNGVTVGAGGVSPAGVWDGVSTFWNSLPAGTGAVAAWNAGDIAAFGAGTDALGPYAITVSGTQVIGGLRFEEGRVTLNGGILQLSAASDFDVAANLTAMVNSIIDGAFDLSKTGAGTLVLGGANTYTGRTLINAGVLSISNDGNLGTAPGASMADSITFGGGALQITGSTPFTLNSNRGMTLNSGVMGTVQVVDQANTVTYGGLITGVAGTTFRKSGAGILDLQGNSTATMLGGLQVDGGTLRLSGAGALAGLTGVTLGNRGTLTLNNTAVNLGDRLAGAITSNGGTLNFTHNGAAATNYSETLGALTLNAGALTINASQAAAAQTSALTIPSIAARSPGSTLFVSGTGLGGNAQNRVILTTAPALTNSVLAYAVVSNGVVTRFATHGGNGTSLAPLTTGYQAAQTAWTAATVNALPTADQTISATRTAYTLTLDNGIDLLGPSADRTLNLSGAVLQTGGSSVIASNGTNENILAWGANEAIFHIVGDLVIQRGNTSNLTGSGGLTKSGIGRLTVAANAITGVLRLNEGAYRAITNTNALGAGTVELNGGNVELAADTSVNFGRATTVNADATIMIDRVTAAATTVTHTLGALGIGDRVLNVAAGPNLTSGTLYGLTFGATTLTGNATFNVSNNGAGLATLTLGAITNSSAFTLTKLGDGDLLTSGAAAFGGPINLQAGRIGWTNNTAATNLLESNPIYGDGGLFKSGSSTVRLTAVNTYSGATTLTAGALEAADGVGLPSASNLVLNGGAFQTNGTFTRSLGTGAGQVQWLAGGAGGGFAAAGGALTVTLSGAPSPLVWGTTPSFVPTTGALIFGSGTADDVVTFTHNIDLNDTGAALSRTITVHDNTTLTTDKAVLPGVLSNSSGDSGVTKNGNGVLQLSGPNTFTGGVTVSTGTLQFETVSNNGGGASNLGQGTDGITLGAARLQFIGAANQSTNRAMTFSGAGILDASGTAGAIIQYNGAINAGANSLNLDGSGEGILNGLVTTTGTAADLNKNGTGTWRIDVAPVIVDNLVISAGTLIFNAADSFTGDDLFIRAGTLKLAVNGALTSAMDDLNISTETAGGGIFDINGTTGSSAADVIIGSNPANQPTSPALSGSMVDTLGGGSFSTVSLNVRNGVLSANAATTGTTTLGGLVSADTGGTNTTSGTISSNLTLNTGSSLALFNGSITGNVTFGSGITLAKHSPNTVTLSGNNVVAGAGASTIGGGILALNYATNTGTKLSAGGITLSGGMLQLNGHATIPVVENVGNLTLGSAADPGGSTIEINIAGASTTVQTGTITRNLGGTLRFHPSSADGHLTTSATNTAGSILGGWATFQQGTGDTNFATVMGGEVVAATSTAIDNVSSWTAGTDITDSTGFAGTLASSLSINSLRFNAASGNSTVTVGAGKILDIASGGILITSNVTAGNPTITGGRLTAGTGNEVIVTHDGTSAFTLGSTLMSNINVTKAGGGLMVLSNTLNSSVGTLRVTGGTVQLMGGGALGDLAPVILDSAGNVLLDVVDSETIGALSGGDSSNYKGMAIQIADTKVLTINQLASGTYYGNISATSGSATLNRLGAGQLTITDGIVNLGTTGIINISGGRLALDINGNNNQLTQITAGTTVNISNGGSLFVEHHGISTGGITAGRIADNVAINLNSGGSTTDSLFYRHDQDGTQTEVIGALTFASGVSSIRVDASSSGTSAISILRATSVARLDQATLVLRGLNIHKTGNPRAQFQNAAVFTGFGTGTTTSLPVLPWAIGPSAGGTAGVGDSFVTTAGTANAQWRPLDLATEYAIVTDTTTWGTAASTNNTRVTTTVTGAASAKTIRSLLLETGSGTVDLTGDGAGALTVDSGGFLFSGTGSSTISGFTGIGVNASVSEYVFHVMGNTATITPALTLSGGKITKSGPGVLVLSGINTALGATSVTAINEGVLHIADLDNIGGNAGGILFAGGTLRLDSTTYSGDDISTRTITMLPGGGTLDTNGNSLVLANAIGNNGTGGFTKAGAGTLTLNAPVTYTGATTINAGTLLYGVAGALPATMNVNLGAGTLNAATFPTTLNSLNLIGNGVLEGSSTVTFTGNSQMDGVASRTLTINTGGTTAFNGDLFTLAGTGTRHRL